MDRQLLLKTWNEAIGGAYYNTLIRAAKYIDETPIQVEKQEFQDDY
jgi:hypothetical protein